MTINKMTKKSFSLLGLFLSTSLICTAQESEDLVKLEFGSTEQAVLNGEPSQSISDELVLQVRIYNPINPTRPIKRSPVSIPSLSLDDHILSFNTSCDGCTLQLVNEEGETDYSIIIPENTSIITLPLNLSGEYELQLVSGEYCFYTNVIL